MNKRIRIIGTLGIVVIAVLIIFLFVIKIPSLLDIHQEELPLITAFPTKLPMKTVTTSLPSPTISVITPIIQSTSNQNSKMNIEFKPFGKLLINDGDKIYFFDIMGKKIDELVRNESINSSPVITKNGDLFYLSDQNAEFGLLDLYRMDLETKRVTRITNDHYFNFNLTSCYEQNIVAYSSNQLNDNGSYRIYIYDSMKMNKPKSVISETQKIFEIACSSDGGSLSYLVTDQELGVGNLYIYHMNKDEKTKIASDITSFSWSPDSRKIAYIKEIADGEELVIKDLSNDIEFTLLSVNGDQRLDAPSFSPDGSRISFEEIIEKSHLLKSIDVDGSNERVLVDSKVINNTWSRYYSVWSPDSQYLAFHKYVTGNFGLLYVVQFVNGHQEQILEGGITSGASMTWFEN